MALATDKLTVGDLVQVRSKEEILATLDTHGRLEGLPFMPQMFKYCGQRFKVSARAHKTCDVVAGEGRRLDDGIHLDIRCDGQAYEGCQMACLIFWKRAWVRRVVTDGLSEGASGAVDVGEPSSAAPVVSDCSEEDVWRATRTKDPASGEMTYFCQATRVPYSLSPWHGGIFANMLRTTRPATFRWAAFVEDRCISCITTLHKHGDTKSVVRLDGHMT